MYSRHGHFIEWMIVPYFAGVLVRFRRRADSGGDLSAGWLVAGVLGSIVILGTLRFGVADGNGAGSDTVPACTGSGVSSTVAATSGTDGLACLSTEFAAGIALVSSACLLNLFNLGC